MSIWQLLLLLSLDFLTQNFSPFTHRTMTTGNEWTTDNVIPVERESWDSLYVQEMKRIDYDIDTQDFDYLQTKYL